MSNGAIGYWDGPHFETRRRGEEIAVPARRDGKGVRYFFATKKGTALL